MSKILCVISGMTDSGFRADNYLSLPYMRLHGYVDTTQGREPESTGCIMRLLGMKKVPDHIQGYAEALGSQIPVGTNDLILRGSWFALDSQGRCTIPVAGPDTLSGIEGCRYYALGQNRSLLVFPGMASFVSDIVTYSPYIHGGQNVLELCPKGCSEVLRVFQAQLQKDRCLMLWGQSVPAGMPSFPQKAAVVCGSPLMKGICRLLDMTLLSVPGATGDIDTDLAAKTQAAIDASKTYPFVLLHFNGAEEAALRKNLDQKRAFLEKIDTVVLPMLLHADCEITVTSDFSADPVTGQHMGNPQPMFMNNQGKVIRKKSDITDRILKPGHTTAEQRRAWAIKQLQRKTEELGRLPQKADFVDVDVLRIKAALGPWPRALETAGLKERK